MSQMHKERFAIKGMSCAACQARIERAVNQLDGVSEVSVQLLQNTMQVSYNDSLSLDAIKKAVSDAGYQADVMDDTTSASASSEYAQEVAAKEQAFFKKLVASIVLTIVLMLFSMGPMVGISLIDSGNINAYVQLLLCIMVMSLNTNYFSSGFKGLAHLSPNMDSLVAISVVASFFYSCVSAMLMPIGMTVEHAHDYALYFESSATILTLVGVGRYLESKAKRKALDANTALLKLAPEIVTVRRKHSDATAACYAVADAASADAAAATAADGAAACAQGTSASGGDYYEQSIALTEVRVGDEIVMRPGDRVGADGVVIEGSAYFDESALTGEPMPVKKEAGSLVQSATFVSSGYIVYRVQKVGKDTALSKIIELVNEANSQKAPIARLADKVAYYFVPSVIVLSIITLIIWLLAGAQLNQALTFAVSVLVISCPCALGLATPTAITVATGRAATLGVLFKSPEAIENLHRINTLVLDKTGTVTQGKMDVMSVKLVGQNALSLHKVLSIAHGLEMRSEHPIAKAIASYAATALSAHDQNDTTTTKVDNFTNYDGKGVTALMDGHRYYMGSKKFLEQTVANAEGELQSYLGTGAGDESVTASATEASTGAGAASADISGSASAGGAIGRQYITIYLFDDNKCYAVFELGDKLKDSAVDAIAEVKALGICPVMVSGDSEQVVSYVASQAGIDSFIGECMPQDKASYVSMIGKQGTTSAMIGDGVNDAPSLRAADVGISLTGATDIATSCADVILMRNDLKSIAHAIELSRLTIRNIKENLFWAFIYNIVCIPLAAGILYVPLGMQLNPMIAALLMSLSSVCVVSNALRLRTQDLAIAKSRSVPSNASHGQAAHDSVISTIKEQLKAATYSKNPKLANDTADKTNIMSDPAIGVGNPTNNESGPGNKHGEFGKASATNESSTTTGVNTMQKIIKIEGMSCQHCVKSVTKTLNAIEGCCVEEVSLENKCARVSVAANVSDEALLAAVTEDGFEALGVENA